MRRARYVVLCADDPGANALPSPATAEVIRYGITSPDARLVAHDIRIEHGGSVFQVQYDGKPMGEVRLRVPGRHNVRNALAALACGIGPWALTVEQMDAVARREIDHHGSAGIEQEITGMTTNGHLGLVRMFAHGHFAFRVTVISASDAGDPSDARAFFESVDVD